jgi:RNA polymerase sigma factor (TIGR02999 family)
MRLILFDHARGMLSQKRGGKLQHIPLNEQLPWVEVGTESMLDLNAALDELRELDPAKVQLVELRYFLGCTIEETAKVLGVSNATVNRDLKFVRSWLFERIGSGKRNAPENT